MRDFPMFISSAFNKWNSEISKDPGGNKFHKLYYFLIFSSPFPQYNLIIWNILCTLLLFGCMQASAVLVKPYKQEKASGWNHAYNQTSHSHISPPRLQRSMRLINSVLSATNHYHGNGCNHLYNFSYQKTFLDLSVCDHHASFCYLTLL